MKYFDSYITEIFERSYPWRLFVSGGNEEDYRFDAVRLAGTDRWIPDPGPSFTPGVPRSIATTDRMQQDYRKSNPGSRQRIVVTFTQHHGTTAYEGMRRINRGLARANFSAEIKPKITLPMFESLWELGFATYIDTDGSGFDKGTDDDIGADNTAHTTRIFGTIIEIVKSFTARKKPQGIFWGTKVNARPARAVIYNGIARRISGDLQAKLYDMPSPRPEMTNVKLAWFGEGVPFHATKNPK